MMLIVCVPMRVCMCVCYVSDVYSNETINYLMSSTATVPVVSSPSPEG